LEKPATFVKWTAECGPLNPLQLCQWIRVSNLSFHLETERLTWNVPKMIVVTNIIFVCALYRGSSLRDQNVIPYVLLDYVYLFLSVILVFIKEYS
jgi:hypothetical protein